MELQIFKNIPLTKTGIKQFSDNLVNEIVEFGNGNPLNLAIVRASLDNVLKEIKYNESYDNALMEEANKYPEKTFEFQGVEITKASKTTYDYSNCNDAILIDLKEQISKLEEQVKIRELTLKSGLDSSTGEVLIKPSTKVTEYLKFTFKK